jgi:hypothetical protein
MPLPQIEDGFQRDVGPDELMVAVDPLECGDIEHPTIIKEPSPGRPVDLFEIVKLAILDKKYRTACGTDIKKRINGVFSPAAKTLVKGLSFGRGD